MTSGGGPGVKWPILDIFFYPKPAKAECYHNRHQVVTNKTEGSDMLMDV